ncbi:MAG: FeoB-associated Cys-rich membrane protein [Bacteroidales bacterium]|nr:FeoB-associated Cys-rich membrane protein [Bacteroidales bacterium]
MSLSDIVILSIVATAVVLAIRHNVKRRKQGTCSCGCNTCTSSCALKSTHQQQSKQ